MSLTIKILCLFILSTTILADDDGDGSIHSNTPSMERIAKEIQENLHFIYERTEELKFSLPTGRRISYVIENEIPLLINKIKNFYKQLNMDKNISQILANFQRYSNPSKMVWCQMNQTSIISHQYLTRNIFQQLKKHDDQYQKLLKNEPDKDNSIVTLNFIKNMKEEINKFLNHEFNIQPCEDNDTESTQKELKLDEFVAYSKEVLNSIITHEKNSQIAKNVRKRRAANGEAIPCTTSDWNSSFISPSSKVIHLIENVTLEIPDTVTLGVFTIEQLYSAELILNILLSCYDDEAEVVAKIEEDIQLKENELASIILESRAQFGNETLVTSTIDGKEVAGESSDGSDKLELLHTIWMCDPNDFILGENVYRFSGVFQTCIEPETNLNEHGKCTGKCNYYKTSGRNQDEFGIDLVKARFSPNHHVNGKQGLYEKLPKCKRLESEVKICPSSQRDIRYSWFSSNDEVFGKQQSSSNYRDSCENELQVFKEEWRMEAASPIMKSPQFCEICLCSCNYLPGDKNPISYFNLAEVTSDVENGMVLTGILFKVTSGIIHAAIEQGKLLKDEEIDEKTLTWKSPNFNSEDNEQYLDPNLLVKLNYDFQKIHLDDVGLFQTQSQSGSQQWRNYYVTGVRFHHHKDHLQLEVQMTKYNSESGSLDVKSSIWINTIDNHSRRNVLNFNATDDPIKSPTPSQPIAVAEGNEESVQFSSGDIKLTAGQIVVPYFDGQAIVPAKRVPIHGIGLFYKGQAGFGGFLSWRLVVIKPEKIPI